MIVFYPYIPNSAISRPWNSLKGVSLLAADIERRPAFATGPRILCALHGRGRERHRHYGAARAIIAFWSM